MCFGPVASFSASAVLASFGVLILRNVRSPKELLFAAFPALFALQQLVEGALWLVLANDAKPEAAVRVLSFGFLLFAYGLWPVLCPASVYAIEYDESRKKVLRFMILAGLTTSLYLLYFIFSMPVSAAAVHCSIRYQTFVTGAPWFAGIYVLATIFPYFISSHRSILIFGLPNLIFCAIAYYLYNWAFVSTWCFFAAIVSLSLYFFLRKLHHQRLLPIPVK